MKIVSTISNRPGSHVVRVSTDGHEKSIVVQARPEGGSAINGGELLFAAIATCFCNDVYREAKKRGIAVSSVTVEVEGEFGSEGEPARNVMYRASVVSDASATEVADLLAHTDRVAEIHNSLRMGVDVRFVPQARADSRLTSR